MDDTMDSSLYRQCSVCKNHFAPSLHGDSYVDAQRNIEVYKKHVEQKSESDILKGTTGKGRRGRKKKDSDSNLICMTCADSCEKISQLQNQLNKVVNQFRRAVEVSTNRDCLYHKKIPKRDSPRFDDTDCDPSDDYSSSSLLINKDSQLEDRSHDGPSQSSHSLSEIRTFPDVAEDILGLKSQIRKPQNYQKGMGPRGKIRISMVSTHTSSTTASNETQKEAEDNNIRDAEAMDIPIVESSLLHVNLNTSIVIKKLPICEDAGTLSPAHYNEINERFNINIADDVPERFKSENIRDIRIKLERMDSELHVGIKTIKQPMVSTNHTLKRKSALNALAFLNEKSWESEDTNYESADIDDNAESYHSVSDDELEVKRNKKRRTKLTLVKVDKNSIEYNCEPCQAVFLNISTYNCHFIAHADESQCSLICPVCKDKNAFSTKYSKSFVRHMKAHTGENVSPCMCCDCGKNFSAIKHLKLHLPLCAPEYTISCDVGTCERRFKNTEDFEKHKEANCDEVKEAPNICKPKPKVSKLRANKNLEHKCDRCGLSGVGIAAFIRHLLSHPDATDRQVCCPVCSKKFAVSSQTILANHMRIHYGTTPYECTECELSFRRPFELTVHRIVHTNEYQFSCDISNCGKKFKLPVELALHKENHVEPLKEESYMCEICGNAYEPTTQRVLVAHARTHEGYRPFKCRFDNCELRFASENTMNVHLQREHLKSQSFSCVLCNAVYFDLGELKKHEKRWHLISTFCEVCATIHSGKCADDYRIACDVKNCKRKFKNHETLGKHKDEDNHNEPNKELVIISNRQRKVKVAPTKDLDVRYYCDPCGLTLRGIVAYMKHLQSHPEATDTHVKCTTCGKQYAAKAHSQFTHHLRFHTGETPYKCTDCELSYRTPQDLKVHRILHTMAYEFSCDISNCGKKFKTINELEYHSQNHPEPNKFEVYRCEVCGDAYEPTSKRVFEVHSLSHEGYLPFQCTFDGCQKRYRTEFNMNCHLQSEHLKSQSFTCEICGKVYYAMDVLKRHKRNVHRSATKAHVCELCGKGHKYKQNLQEHMVHQHYPSEKRHECSECGNKYSTHYKLSQHIKLKHRKEFDFVCETCAKVFHSKQTLDDHRRMHTNEKLKCKICGETFAIRVHFSEHMRLVHAGGEPNNCQICDKNFSCRNSKKRHMKKLHCVDASATKKGSKKARKRKAPKVT